MGLDLASCAFVERSRAYVMDEEALVSNYKLAGVGLVLLLAPLYFVSASLLKYGLGVGFLFDPLESLLSEPGGGTSSTWSLPWSFWAGWCSRWR